MPYEALYSTFAWFAPQLPAVIALIIGALVAIRNRNRHPQVSRLVVAYVALEMLIKIMALSMMLLPSILSSRGYDFRLSPFMIDMFAVATNLVHAGAVVLILCAALGWRRTASPSAPIALRSQA